MTLDRQLAKLGIRYYRRSNNDVQDLHFYMPESNHPEEVVHNVSPFVAVNPSGRVHLNTSPQYAAV